MKYYKSKRGYFYKVVGDKKTRISIEEYKSMKGGKLEANGELDKTNFSQIIEIPSRRVRNNNENSIELQEMKRENVKNNNIDINSIPEPKIMRQKGFRKEPYIFFGFNPNTKKYRYVFYNDLSWFSKKEIIPSNNITNEKKVICKKLKDNDEIVEIKHIDITNIPLKILSHLFIFLLKKRKENEDFMERLFNYLYNVIYHKITKSKNEQLTYYNNTERIINPNIDFNFLEKYYNIDEFKKQFINTPE
jgi:hypothetical protein